MSRPPTSRRVPALPAALLVAVGVVLLWAAPVAAHAALADMSPVADSVLADAPTEVRLTFTEEVTASQDSIRVFDPSARELGGLEVGGEGREVVAELPDLEDPGSYTVAWRAVSADGHPISGAYLFHLQEATLSEPVEAGAPGSSTTSDAFRALGAVLALGGLVLCLAAALVGPGRAAPRWWGLRWVPVVAGTTSLLGAAVVSVGSGLSDSLEVVLDTSSGRMAVLALVLSLAGLVASVAPVPRPVDPALAALTVVAVALQGHAVSIPPVALSAVLTVAHVAAAVLWAAGLFWLEHRVRTTQGEDLPPLVRRWSPRATAAVAVLALSGAALVVDRVPLADLLTENYGRLALVKVLLLAVAVLLAWRNQQSVGTTDAESADGGSADGEPGRVAVSLRRGIRVEMVVLALALVAGAVLAQVPPPDGDGVTGGYYVERRPFGDGQVELTVDPGARGTNEVHVTALGDDGRLMAEAADLALGVELPAEELGPIEPEMQPITQGHSSAYVRIPLEGTWTFTVTARVDRFTELTAEFQVPVGE